MTTINLDNNATTAVAPEVREAMLPFLDELYGNASSIHALGRQPADALWAARGKVAALIGADPAEIIFTSCGTESDNTAIMSALNANPGKKHIITTKVEHPAVYNLCKYLLNKDYRVTFLPVDNLGRFSMDAFQKALDDDVAIVSVMYANNETGVLFPIEEIGAVLRERSILFHTDAVQAAGKVRLDLKTLSVDMLSISGHKLHAPKGIGVLYVRKGTPFYPLIIGGHQENGRRAGTENVASIVGLGRACELAMEGLDNEAVYLSGLRDKLESALIANCPDARVNGDVANRLPNTTNISFEHVEGEAILLSLDEYGICASSGSACTSGSAESSHVLLAMGVPFTAMHGSIRFSLSRYNSEPEIERVVEVLPGIIEKLRIISPYGRGK